MQLESLLKKIDLNTPLDINQEESELFSPIHLEIDNAIEQTKITEETSASIPFLVMERKLSSNQQQSQKHNKMFLFTKEANNRDEMKANLK